MKDLALYQANPKVLLDDATQSAEIVVTLGSAIDARRFKLRLYRHRNMVLRKDAEEVHPYQYLLISHIGQAVTVSNLAHPKAKLMIKKVERKP
jgi:hypothetical protein